MPLFSGKRSQRKWNACAALVFLFAFNAPPFLHAEAGNEEAPPVAVDASLSMIEERMKILSGGLGHMALPPDMDKKIQVPGMEWTDASGKSPAHKETKT